MSVTSNPRARHDACNDVASPRMTPVVPPPDSPRSARDPAHRHRLADHHRARLGRHLRARRARLRPGPVQHLLAVEVAHASPAASSSASGACTAPRSATGSPTRRTLPGFGELHHLVIVPTCGEGEEILADTLHYLTLQDVPLDASRSCWPSRSAIRWRRLARSDSSARFALAVRPLPGHLPPRPAGRGQGQVLEPDLGRATRRGRADRRPVGSIPNS